MRGQTALLPSGPEHETGPDAAEVEQPVDAAAGGREGLAPWRGAQHDERDDDLQAEAPRHRLAVDRGAVGRPGERDRQQDE